MRNFTTHSSLFISPLTTPHSSSQYPLSSLTPQSSLYTPYLFPYTPLPTPLFSTLPNLLFEFHSSLQTLLLSPLPIFLLTSHSLLFSLLAHSSLHSYIQSPLFTHQSSLLPTPHSPPPTHLFTPHSPHSFLHFPTTHFLLPFSTSYSLFSTP